MMKTKEQVSRYEEIAYLIAKKIVNGEYKESDKLRGRSLLSSEYSVSSETIRKAIQLLSNHDVVNVKEQSGIYVYSKANAKHYIQFFDEYKASKSLFHDTQELLELSQKVNHDLQKKFKRIIQSAENNHFPFTYFTCDVFPESTWIGKTISELNLYDVTGGMIIGIEEDDLLYQAPNPKTIIREHMILYILGNQEVKENTHKDMTKNRL